MLLRIDRPLTVAEVEARGSHEAALNIRRSATQIAAALDRTSAATFRIIVRTTVRSTAVLAS